MQETAKTKAQPLETITVETGSVGCDGAGSGAHITPQLGHPLVYLNLGHGGAVDCPYCGRRYVLAAGARAAGAH
ncbi:MAG: zinc-finger domain-containing protein [Alphaproteobacteria bacterium]|nr:zinc-finger domain-containing protein [Alphaproteobacteria bacterium]